MGSLFQGSPQTATSYTTSSTETPKWMQDAIFNQVQWAQNLANKPYQSYDMPTVAELSDLQQQAYKNVQKNQGFYQGDLDKAQSGMYGMSGKGTAADLTTAQNKYLQNPATALGQLETGQGYFDQAGQQDIMGAANPYLAKADTTTAQALSDKAMTAANPYLTAAAGKSYSDVANYMSPYQTGVMDVIAKQGARNLSENLLPNVSDAFIRAGQFGGSRMGEFGNRAVRDTQEAILNQQAQLANQGYGQAMSAAQADLARQAGLASTAGGIAGGDLSRVLQGAGQYQNLAQTAGSLTGQQQQNLASLGQAQTAAGQTQQQFGLGAAQAAQAAQAADYQRQMSALQQFANMQQQEQAMRGIDTAALESAGSAQQNQMQQQLNAAKSQFDAERLYPQQQMDWLSTQIRGMAPITPTTTTNQGTTTGATYSPSPLSTLATGLYTYKGLDSLSGSDIRIKENIKRVGEMSNGLGIYEFEYKPEFKNHPLCGHGRFRGVMAHEVAQRNPGAVVRMDNGYNAVNYDLIAA